MSSTSFLMTCTLFYHAAKGHTGPNCVLLEGFLWRC